jgi:cell wall-associated NlpC family hydrolase
MAELDKQKFISDLRSLVGTETRWRHQGRDPETGLDCLGFPIWALTQQIELPAELWSQLLPYHHKPDGQKLLRTIREWFDEVSREEMQMADLVVIYDRRNPQHIAVACDNENVVESYASGRLMKIVYWPLGTWREIAGVFRFPETGVRAEKWQQ